MCKFKQDVYNLINRISLLLLLTSCSLQAVYSEKYMQITNHEHKICAIEVIPIKSVKGAELYQHLSDIMPHCSPVRYQLTIELNDTSAPSILKKNSDILRQNTSQIVRYKLLDITTQQVIDSGQFRQTSSYNTAISAYATHNESELTSEILAKYAAEEVLTRLILFFGKH